MTPDEWQAVPRERKIAVGVRNAYGELEAAVKFLCKLSQRPGDEFDLMAMKLGAVCDRLYDALPEPDRSGLDAFAQKAIKKWGDDS